MMGLENPQKCVKKDKIPSPPDLLLSLPTLYYLGAKHSSVSCTFYWKMIIYPPWNQQIASEIREGLFIPSDQAKPETTRFPPGFAWTPKSRRFWRKQRAEPEEPRVEAVKETLKWLKEKDLARKESETCWVGWPMKREISQSSRLVWEKVSIY